MRRSIIQAVVVRHVSGIAGTKMLQSSRQRACQAASDQLYRWRRPPIRGSERISQVALGRHCIGRRPGVCLLSEL